jgi:hypothetical protein
MTDAIVGPPIVVGRPAEALDGAWHCHLRGAISSQKWADAAWGRATSRTETVSDLCTVTDSST